MRVRVTKTQETRENNYGVTVGYWVEGYLISFPEPGKRMIIQRDIRNGIKMSGVFTTSLVKEIKSSENDYYVYTENSTYLVQEVGDPEK